MKDERIYLTAREAQVVEDALDEYLTEDQSGGSEEDRQIAFRLLVKLDKRGGPHIGAGMLVDLPYWIRQILHRTFAPDQAPAKKAAPKAPHAGAGAASAAGTKKPAPSTPATARGAASTPGKS